MLILVVFLILHSSTIIIRSLASLADAYINDAFGTSHRAHASVSGVPALLPEEVCGLGLLVSSELSYLDFSSKKAGDIVVASK